MNNWESFIKAIVPLSFMAIWALSSLFNRDNKPKPTLRPTMLPPRPQPGTRGGEPTLRWNAPDPSAIGTAQSSQPLSRSGTDDGIVILSSDGTRRDRDANSRLAIGGPTGKRPAKGKPVVPQRKPEPAPARARLAGVSQNVNQHLTNINLEMTPLSAMPLASAMPSLGLNSVPTLAPDTIGVTPRSATSLALRDPARLREAFLLNEVLSPPVSMRARRIGPAPQ